MNPRQQSILVGAIVIGVLNTSYLSFINYLCCLGVILGGILTAQQYVSRSTVIEGPLLDAGNGAILGALAGVGGMILGTLFNLALRPIELDSSSIMMETIQPVLQGQQGMSPEMMQDETGMLTAMGIVFFALTLIVFAIFGAVGGAIGAAIFGGEEQA